MSIKDILTRNGFTPDPASTEDHAFSVEKMPKKPGMEHVPDIPRAEVRVCYGIMARSGNLPID